MFNRHPEEPVFSFLLGKAIITPKSPTSDHGVYEIKNHETHNQCTTPRTETLLRSPVITTWKSVRSPVANHLLRHRKPGNLHPEKIRRQRNNRDTERRELSDRGFRRNNEWSGSYEWTRAVLMNEISLGYYFVLNIKYCNGFGVGTLSWEIEEKIIIKWKIMCNFCFTLHSSFISIVKSILKF